MSRHQTALLNLFSKFEIKSKDLFSDEAVKQLQSLSEIELADVFFNVAFLATAMSFLKEEHWLQHKQENPPESFLAFIKSIFKSELSPIAFLQSYFETSSLKDSEAVRQKAQLIESLTITLIKSRANHLQRDFAIQALTRMAVLFEYEIELNRNKKEQGLHLGLSFYRTFDRLDEVLGLNYESELGMKEDLRNSERLYAGAGVGVQSGYSTVLTALHNLDLKAGDRMIDLGSGYGRVGLVVGLLKQEIDFKGYEFVKHRVDAASFASQRLGLDNHVSFHTCDLSSPTFQIPDAEVYYLYDPFNEETYTLVLNQLVSISQQHKMTIVTKGNARAPLLEIAKREGWPPPREFDNRNLCLFGT